MRHATYHKTVIINRAVPGSGKTTISRCITNVLNDAGLKIGTHSTDDFFMVGNRYCFDITSLNRNHLRNQELFLSDLEKGMDVVICDNTNLQPWQSAPYTNFARKYGYRILFLNFLPRELWKHVKSQIVSPEKPDAHEVPEERLVEFIRDFNDYNDLLLHDAEVNPQIHRDFIWNEHWHMPVETGRPAEHFDNDIVITIHPDEYRLIQNVIGDQVLDMIAG